MVNSDRFLSQYNKIGKHLCKVTGKGKEISFSSLVKDASKSDKAVKYYADDLREFADLRNAIVHERTDGHVIAEPNDEAVRRIEQITSQLTAPPKIISLGQKQVSELNITDPIAEAVKLMLDKSFSQIPIYDGQEFSALLTTNTVTRWLGACVQEDILSLKETPIESVLKYAEEQDNHYFLSRNATVLEALEKFQEGEKKGKRLEAILITQNGKATETLLGIVTIWDLSAIYQGL